MEGYKEHLIVQEIKLSLCVTTQIKEGFLPASLNY